MTLSSLEIPMAGSGNSCRLLAAKQEIEWHNNEILTSPFYVLKLYILNELGNVFASGH
jgi:hypothetical protein